MLGFNYLLLGEHPNLDMSAVVCTLRAGCAGYGRAVLHLQYSRIALTVTPNQKWCDLYYHRMRVLIDGSALLCRVKRKLRFLRNRLKTFPETSRYKRSIGLLQIMISSQVLIYVLTGAVMRGHPQTPQQVQGALSGRSVNFPPARRHQSRHAWPLCAHVSAWCA